MSTTAKEVSVKWAYAEVVVSFATALALLFTTAVQLMYRSSRRHQRIEKAKRQIRFSGAYFLQKSKGDQRRKIIERGMEEYKYRIVNPPQYNRFIPPVIAGGRDSRADCLLMLQKVREALRKTYGPTVRLMTMRCCLSSIKGVLQPNQLARFLQTYEGILFGEHRSGSSLFYVTEEDTKFLYAFFYSKVMPELQQ